MDKKNAGEIKCLEKKQNGNPTYQNLWDTAIIVLGGNFIATNAYQKEKVIKQLNSIW